MTEHDVDPQVTPLAEWLGRLAQAKGAPGGGAACGVMAAISASLLGMVAGYSDGPEAARAAARLERVRLAATTAAEEDGIRSAAFGAALAMDDGAPRERAVRSATVEAIASSLEIGRIAASLLDEARLLADIGSRHVEADLLVALEALRAALAGTAVTAGENLQLLAGHRADGDDLDDRIATFGSEVDGLRQASADVERLVGELQQDPRR